MKYTIHILILLVIAAAAAGVGYKAGIGVGEKRAQESGYRSGWEAAKARLYRNGVLQELDSDVDIRSVTGRITKIIAGGFVAAVAPVDALGDPTLDERTIRVENTTKVIRLKEKDKTEYGEELSAYSAAHPDPQSEPDGGSMPPNPYREEIIGLDGVKVGDTVVAQAAENIRTAPAFTATLVQIQP